MNFSGSIATRICSLHHTLNCACGAGSWVAARQRFNEGDPPLFGWHFSCVRPEVAIGCAPGPRCRNDL